MFYLIYSSHTNLCEDYSLRPTELFFFSFPYFFNSVLKMASNNDTAPFLPSKPEYSKISFESEDSLPQETTFGENEAIAIKKRGRRMRCSFVRYTLVILMTSAAWALALHFTTTSIPVSSIPFNVGPKHSLFYKRKFLGCGKSIAEAKALGCEYDSLANHYVPKICIDQQSIAQYREIGDSWIPYEDANRTRPIPPSLMGERASYYTNMRDHVVHCSVLWKRQWKAFKENRRYFDSIIADEKHTNHCADLLLAMTDTQGSADLRDIPISVEVGFAGCIDRQHIDDRYL